MFNGGDIMDIAAISTQLAMSKNLSDVGTAMLSKTMDMQKTEAAGIVNMIDAASMERAVNPHIGGNFDMSI